jgi:hypothetical protein
MNNPEAAREAERQAKERKYRKFHREMEEAGMT